MDSPRVSVSMVTFQHARLIDQAIESVVSQDEPSVELVIGDDQSDDGTLERARAWEARYPDRVRVLDPVPEKLLGRKNFFRTRAACRGKYVGYLDGDDWFLVPHKLRVQADLLDAHPDYSGCVTASQEYDDEGRPLGEPDMINAKNGPLTSKDFVRRNRAASSASLWRRGLIDSFPEWWWKAPVGDWPMHMLYLEHGPYGYIDESMSAHRQHSGGVWSSKTAVQRIQIDLACQSGFLDYLSEQTQRSLKSGLLYWRWRQARKALRRGEPAVALEMIHWLEKYGRQMDPFTRWRIAHHRRRVTEAASSVALR